MQNRKVILFLLPAPASLLFIYVHSIYIINMYDPCQGILKINEKLRGKGYNESQVQAA